MHSDHHGFLWLCTEEGLYRFDGKEYKLYTSKDPWNGLGKEKVDVAYTDKKNNLWVGARSGLYRYDTLQNDFVSYMHIDDSYVWNIQEDDGFFWVQNVHGAYKFYQATGKNVKQDLPVGWNHQLIIGTGDDLWISGTNKLHKFNKKTQQLKSYQIPFPPFTRKEDVVDCHRLAIDNKRHVWINTWWKGVIKFDPVSEKFEAFYDEENSKLYPSLTNSIKTLGMHTTNFAPLSDGTVWFANQEGVNIYNHNSYTFSYLPKYVEGKEMIDGNDLYVIKDNKENIWLRTTTSLYYYPRNYKKAELIPQNPNTGKLIGDMFSITKFQDRFILSGSYFGLYSTDLLNKNIKRYTTEIGLPSYNVAEFQNTSGLHIVNDDSIFISTVNGLNLVKPIIDKSGLSLKLINLKKIFDGWFPTKIFPLGKNLLLIKGAANSNSFVTYNIRKDKFEIHYLPDKTVYSDLIKLNDNQVFISVRNRGFLIYDIANKKYNKYILPKHKDKNIGNKIVGKVFPLRDNKIGICTDGHGLMIYDSKVDSFIIPDIGEKLSSQLIRAVHEDKYGRLWIQSPKLMMVYDPKTEKKSLIQINQNASDGIPTYHIPDGDMLYFATPEGFNYLHVDSIKFKTNAPSLFFNEIKSGNRILDKTKSIALSNKNEGINVSFIALDYENPDGLKYFYTIEGIDDKWISLDNNTSVNIANLNHGKYSIKVKAQNDVGNWSNTISTPVITIYPPFYSTWWFILLSIVSMSSLVYGYLWLQKRRKVSEEKIRNQISKDLHDDIGSTLSGIKIYSNIARNYVDDKKALSEILSDVENKSDEMMQNMKDIVWSVNPANDNLNAIFIKLKQYAVEVLETKNVNLHLHLEDQLKDIRFDVDKKKNIYLALKEIINNAAKHSQCSNFHLSIQKQNDKIEINIGDDGKGIPEQLIMGNGLGNIETRITQIKGTVRRENNNGLWYKIVISP